jgi:membrane protein implicated in regulation of membrane protease activity
MQFPITFQPTQQFAYQTQGILDRPITPTTPGRVYFEATYWRACLFQPETNTTLQPGDKVEVLGRNGLTLLVQPISAGQRKS